MVNMIKFVLSASLYQNLDNFTTKGSTVSQTGLWDYAIEKDVKNYVN